PKTVPLSGDRGAGGQPRAAAGVVFTIRGPVPGPSLSQRFGRLRHGLETGLSAEPLARLADLIASRTVSSREVVASCLTRIAEVTPTLNAVVQLRAEGALDEADACDREVANGSVRGPLHGVPFTIKDWIDVAGLPCTGGFVKHRNRVPDHDATVVARLR